MPAALVRDRQHRLRAGAVGDHAPTDAGQDPLDVLVVEAEDGCAVERDLIDELGEGGFDFIDPAGVVVEVLAVDVGDDGEDGRELQERAIALVGLDHEELAGPETGVAAAHGADASADNDCGVKSGVDEDGRDHRRRGGLAVAAGDCDAELQPHEFGEKFASGNYGDADPPGFLNFGVGLIDGGADDERLGSFDVLRGVAFDDAGAAGGKTLRDWRELHVGAGDLVAEGQQDLGDAAHADAADPGEMKLLLLKKHLLLVLFRLSRLLSTTFRA